RHVLVAAAQLWEVVEKRGEMLEFALELNHQRGNGLVRIDDVGENALRPQAGGTLRGLHHDPAQDGTQLVRDVVYRLDGIRVDDDHAPTLGFIHCRNDASLNLPQDILQDDLAVFVPKRNKGIVDFQHDSNQS